MPATISELYETAATAMLERLDRKERGAAASAAAVPHLTALLEATFFQAHAEGRRVIEEQHLLAAALTLASPATLQRLTEQMWGGDDCADGTLVEVTQPGGYYGRRGKCRGVKGHSIDVEIALEHGEGGAGGEGGEGGEGGGGGGGGGGGARTMRVLVHRMDLRSTGLSTEEYETNWLAALREACAQLPTAIRNAVVVVRERVAQDRLPLLTLLQADPLQLQSSHLSFQEYFCAKAICKGFAFPAACGEPWRWPPWWSNCVQLGLEMGDAFRVGMLRGAGHAHSLQQRALDLSARPDPNTGQTVNTIVGSASGGVAVGVGVAVAAELLRCVTRVDLRDNALSEAELQTIAAGAVRAPQLEALTMDAGGELPVKALRGTAQDDFGMVTAVDLSAKQLGDASLVVLAALVTHNRVITSLSLQGAMPFVTVVGMRALAAMLTAPSERRRQRSFMFATDNAAVGPHSLESLNLRSNSMGDDAADVLLAALEACRTPRCALRKVDLSLLSGLGTHREAQLQAAADALSDRPAAGLK